MPKYFFWCPRNMTQENSLECTQGFQFSLIKGSSCCSTGRIFFLYQSEKILLFPYWHSRNGSLQYKKIEAGLVKIINTVTLQVKERKLAAVWCPCIMKVWCSFPVLFQKHFQPCSQGKTDGPGKSASATKPVVIAIWEAGWISVWEMTG